MSQPVIKGALVECERCGVQRVMLDDLVLRVGIHDGRGAVRFRCEGCGQIRLRPIGSTQATSMAGTDITIEWWEPPRELHERDVRGDITVAEIGEWRQLLADDHAFADVVSTLAEGYR